MPLHVYTIGELHLLHIRSHGNSVPGFSNCLRFSLQDLAVVPLSSQPGSDASSDSGSSSESEGEREEVKRFPLRLPKSTRHKKRTIAIQELPCR